MAVSMHLLISCNRSRAKFPFRSHPTNFSRNTESIMAGASAHAARNSDQRLVRLYLDMLAAERGAGANTLAAYQRDLEDLCAYLRGIRRAIASARTADLRAFLEELSRRGLKSTTAARRLSAIRQLYRFLYTEGPRRGDSAPVLERAKRQPALPQIHRVADAARLF